MNLIRQSATPHNPAMLRTIVVTLKRNEYAVEGIRGIRAPSPLLLVAFLRAFRRCQGVILHSQPWCTASTSILTRSALARGIGSPGRTTAIASLSSATKLLSSVLADIIRLFRCAINRDGYHAPEEEVQPTHLRSGEFPSNSYRCSHFVLCWVSHRRRHWRKGLECTAHSHRRRLSLRYPCWYDRTAAERIVPPRGHCRCQRLTLSPQIFLSLPRPLLITPGPVSRVPSLNNF